MIKRGEAEAAEASLACDCLLQQERNDTNKNRKSSIHKEQQLLDLPPDSFRKGQMYRMEGFMHACMDKKMLSEQFRNKYFYGGKHQRESEVFEEVFFSCPFIWSFTHGPWRLFDCGDCGVILHWWLRRHRRVSSVKIIRFLRQTHFSFPSKRKEPKIFSRKLLFCNPLTRFEIWAYLQKILRVILVTAAWKRQVRGDLSAPMISLTLFLVLWQCYQAKEFLSQKESWVYHRPTVFENH